MTKNEKYIKTFLSIGGEVEISTSSFDALVKIFCELYGHRENSAYYVRCKFYPLTCDHLKSKAIPSCSDCLNLHISRANYQV